MTRFAIGSYSIPSPWAAAPHAHGVGISTAELDRSSGEMRLLAERRDTNPSFLVAAPEPGVLWAVTEPERGGELVRYRVTKRGRLEVQARLVTGADAPCHLALDWDNRLAFVSHYHGGRVATVRLSDEGSPNKIHALTTPPERTAQADLSIEPPRPHSSFRVGDSQLLVADTGRDQVLLYEIRATGEGWDLQLQDTLPLPLGSGPRHIAMHPTGAVYVSNEGSGGVSVLRLEQHGDRARIRLEDSTTSPTLGRARAVPSEIAVHPAFSVVYMANRLDNSLSIFAADPADGSLSPLLALDTLGRNPRHFRVAPTGDYLLIAHQDSDEVVAFRISKQGQSVAWAGHTLRTATPTAICFW